MSQSPVISKNKERTLTQDHEALRRLGLEHIEKFGHALWTDHNIHDPGITILEALCYAITDLGHRTSLPIEDILAREPGDSTRDLFTAREILPCNPVTFDDLRKKIIDVEGVQNAWVLPWNDACGDEVKHPAYFIKCEPVQQRFTINANLPENNNAGFVP
ncbi:MAG TPA: hypothetical protein VK907_12655, partial [Phnomibacter sp.]|nr:hypothetical protein [Phnomibacter sp.]